MDLKTMSLEQLQAMAYNIIKTIEQSQHNLRVVENEISIKSQIPEPKETKKK